MSLDRLIKLLKAGTSYTDGTWVLVMGGRGNGLESIRDSLGQMSIDVQNAETLDDALTLIAAHDLPPVLAYLFADGLGGLEAAISVHSELQKHTHIGKCLIVSSEAQPDIDFSKVDENSPLILAAPRRTRLK
jgi:hypothetical protein